MDLTDASQPPSSTPTLEITLTELSGPINMIPDSHEPELITSDLLEPKLEAKDEIKTEDDIKMETDENPQPSNVFEAVGLGIRTSTTWEPEPTVTVEFGGDPADEKDKVCTFCRYNAPTAAIYKQHMKMHDRTDMHIACSLCSFKSKHTANITEHYVQVHMIDRERGLTHCEHCKFMTCDPPSFKQHMKVHFIYKPRVCEVCWMTFASSSNQNLHMFKKHTEEERTGVGYVAYAPRKRVVSESSSGKKMGRPFKSKPLRTLSEVIVEDEIKKVSESSSPKTIKVLPELLIEDESAPNTEDSTSPPSLVLTDTKVAPRKRPISESSNNSSSSLKKGRTSGSKTRRSLPEVIAVQDESKKGSLPEEIIDNESESVGKSLDSKPIKPLSQVLIEDESKNVSKTLDSETIEASPETLIEDKSEVLGSTSTSEDTTSPSRWVITDASVSKAMNPDAVTIDDVSKSETELPDDQPIPLPPSVPEMKRYMLPIKLLLDCGFCGSRTGSKRELAQHLLSVHRDEKVGPLRPF